MRVGISVLAWLGLVLLDYVCCRSRLDWLDWLGIYVIFCPDVDMLRFTSCLFIVFFPPSWVGRRGEMCVCEGLEVFRARRRLRGIEAEGLGMYHV